MKYFLTLKCLIDSTVEGDNNNIIRKQNKYDMSKDEGQKCSKWFYVGYEIFKIWILIIIMLTLAFWLGKHMFGKNGLISKYKQSRLKSRERKFEKMRA